jgi:hypothetical protein
MDAGCPLGSNAVKKLFVSCGTKALGILKFPSADHSAKSGNAAKLHSQFHVMPKPFGLLAFESESTQNDESLSQRQFLQVRSDVRDFFRPFKFVWRFDGQFVDFLFVTVPKHGRQPTHSHANAISICSSDCCVSGLKANDCRDRELSWPWIHAKSNACFLHEIIEIEVTTLRTTKQIT